MYDFDNITLSANSVVKIPVPQNFYQTRDLTGHSLTFNIDDVGRLRYVPEGTNTAKSWQETLAELLSGDNAAAQIAQGVFSGVINIYGDREDGKGWLEADVLIENNDVLMVKEGGEVIYARNPLLEPEYFIKMNDILESDLADPFTRQVSQDMAQQRLLSLKHLGIHEIDPDLCQPVSIDSHIVDVRRISLLTKMHDLPGWAQDHLAELGGPGFKLTNSNRQFNWFDYICKTKKRGVIGLSSGEIDTLRLSMPALMAIGEPRVKPKEKIRSFSTPPHPDNMFKHQSKRHQVISEFLDEVVSIYHRDGDDMEPLKLEGLTGKEHILVGVDLPGTVIDSKTHIPTLYAIHYGNKLEMLAGHAVPLDLIEQRGSKLIRIFEEPIYKMKIKFKLEDK